MQVFPALGPDVLGLQYGGNPAERQLVLVPELPGAGAAGLLHLLLRYSCGAVPNLASVGLGPSV